MIVTSFEEQLKLAPANATSAWNNPFGDVTYDKPMVISGLSGLGIFDPISLGVTAGINVAEMAMQFLQPSRTGVFKQDATTLVNGLVAELNSVDSALKQNPTCANKEAAISFFWNAWSQLVNGCMNFGGPGTNCVNDRAQGGKYSWWTYYLNPWTNLKCVADSSASAPPPGAVANPPGSTGSYGGNVPTAAVAVRINPLYLALGAAVLAYVFIGGQHAS